MKKLLVLAAGIAALGFVGTASAADMPASMPTKAPMMMAPAYNWTGLYVGINGGYGSGHSYGGLLDAFPAFGGQFTAKGGLIGAQIGYNYQIDHLVLGVEGDWDYASISGGATGGPGFSVDGKIRDIGTLRARIGYAWDRVLFYGTGGFAWGHLASDITGPTASESHSLNGYAVGGGLEYGVTQNISVKAEYIYTRLNTANYFVAAGCPGPCDLGARANLFRVGANWRFWGM